MRSSFEQNSSRRDFLARAGAGAGGVLLASLGSSSRGAIAKEVTTGSAARREAAHRRRRVVYNNDGDDIWTKGVRTIEDFLADRHDPLIGTQVDSIHYCTTQSFNYFTHDTDVAERFLVHEGMFAENNFEAFLRQKTDGLRLSVAFSHRHQLESIWSLRMNDIHDVAEPLFGSKWKKEDPRRVMSTREIGLSHTDRRRLWSLVDFEHPDVAPRVVAIVEEVLRKYPVDGVELDWMRAPFYFRTAYAGEHATAQQTDLLTQLVTEIRQLVLRESERQGKPLLLKTRVPVTLENSRRIGIDVATWLQNGLIDVLAVSGGYVPFHQPIQGLIELGHRHDVPVYACISRSGMSYRKPRSDREITYSAEGWYAAAKRCFHLGADGIYTFNLFANGKTPQSEFVRSIVNRIGTVESLEGVDKMYCISDAGNFMPASYWSKDVEVFDKDLPIDLAAGQPTQLPALTVYESAGELRRAVSCELRVDFSGVDGTSLPQVQWNGKPVPLQQPAETVAAVRRVQMNLPPSEVKPGENALVLTAGQAGIRCVGAELWVRYGNP